mgnify:CR=1 FL=1
MLIYPVLFRCVRCLITLFAHDFAHNRGHDREKSFFCGKIRNRDVEEVSAAEMISGSVECLAQISVVGEAVILAKAKLVKFF